MCVCNQNVYIIMPSAITSLLIFQAISCRIRFRVIDGEARRNSAPVLFYCAISLKLRALINAGCSADKSEVCALDYCSSVESFCQSVRNLLSVGVEKLRGVETN